MKTSRNLTSLLLLFPLLVLLTGSRSGGYDEESVPFDFTDQFYLENGVDPSAIPDRLGTPTSLFPSVVDEADNRDRRDVRNLMVIPAYSHSGKLVFFHVMGHFNADGFTDDEAGEEAFEIVEDADLYLFPIEGIDPVTTPLPFPFRQDSLMDLRHGYYSNNPLGIWVLKFGVYTEKAKQRKNSHKVLRKLARKNGVGSDGLPLIRTRSELRKLKKKKLLKVVTRPLTGGLPRYSICPAYKDPRDGVIRADNFPLPGSEQDALEALESLQTTGNCPIDYDQRRMNPVPRSPARVYRHGPANRSTPAPRMRGRVAARPEPGSGFRGAQLVKTNEKRNIEKHAWTGHSGFFFRPGTSQTTSGIKSFDALPA